MLNTCLRARPRLLALLLAVSPVFAGQSFAAPAPTGPSSAGCTSVNAGNLDASITYPASNYATRTVSSFVAGDTLNITITMSNVSSNDQWWITAGGTLVADHAGSSTTTSYTVTGSGDTTVDSVLRIQSNTPTATITSSITCTPGPVTSDDSASLTSVQASGSRMAAGTSGAAIGGATSAGTDAAFSGAAPVTAGANGFTVNFAADPAQRAAAARTRNAFSALGFADDGYRAAAADQPLNIWANVRGSWLTNDIDGSHVNATVGLGYKVTPDLVVGAFAGLESFDYDFDSVSGNLQGSGGTVGAYAGWRVFPALRLDGMVGWSGLSYDATAATATGSFDASRWIVSTGLTGTHHMGGVTVAPSAKLYVLWENQDGYTDSLATVHDDLSFYTGRASLGGRISKAFVVAGDLMLNPYLALYGDWRFSDVDGVGTTDTGAEDGLSGRTGAGLSLTTARGVGVSLGGEVGGLGQDTQIWSATGRLSVPF